MSHINSTGSLVCTSAPLCVSCRELAFRLDSDLLRVIRSTYSLEMAGGLFGTWWSRVGPYYTKAYQEVWVGLGIMTYFYYKISYGGKKAVKSKSDHSH
ncbi:hypothetical protein PGIGA_G00097870 [Pangasianodon gigas]|uniref:Uncharacterized protein n=1 Tax=Pangasianodon gigas TaxID=30993 RepID=A0ACC5XDH8_PANGG|nr:hypothetical protein [Pangasianodon gigas]